MCELALELGVPLYVLDGESNYDVCVTWPTFFEERARMERIEQEKQKQRQRGAR